MDESESLDAVAELLNELGNDLYNVSLHVKHIQQCAQIGESHVQLAREMFVSSLAAGEDVWLPLIEQKLSTEDLESLHGLKNVLAIFDQAENDYLCGFPQSRYIMAHKLSCCFQQSPSCGSTSNF